MTDNQIDKFIRKYGGKYIDFLIENKKSKYVAATTYCLGFNEITNRPIYVIGLQKDIFKAKIKGKDYESYLKSLLLHEIGHIKQKHFQRNITPATAEYEAQLWALHQSQKYKFSKIKIYAILVFLGWKEFKNKKRQHYYYNAYTKFYKFAGKEYIKLSEQLIQKLFKNKA